MKIKFNKITAVLLSVILVVSAGLVIVSIHNEKQNTTDDENTEVNVDLKSIDEKSVCHSKDNNASFYIDKEGHFELINNVTGKSWYSIPQNSDKDTVSNGITATNTRSELVIEYILREDVNTQYSPQTSNSAIMCKDGGVSVKQIDGGFKVYYDFKDIDIKIPIEYKFVGSRLDASVVVDEIDEGKKAYLISLEVLPYFGAADNEEKGYLLIPDGSGAIAEFNQNIKPVKNYEKRVYGNDASHSDIAFTSKEYDIKLPVFGLVTENNALMGVITEGDGAASILAKTGSDEIFYNSIGSKMNYRICAKDDALYIKEREGMADAGKYIYTLTETEFGLDKYTLGFFLLSNEDASYSGMARRYKEYLAEKYSLKQKKTTTSLAVRAYGAVEEKKNFLGISYYDKIALTTYGQMEQILSDLKKEGIENIAVQYVGWTGNGVTNRVLPLNAKALSILGGKNELNSLNNYSEQHNIELYLDTDILHFKKSGNGITARGKGAKAPNGDTAKLYDYSMVTFLQNKKTAPSYLLSFINIEASLNKYLKSFDKIGNNSISFSTLGNTMYSDFKSNAGIYRAKVVKTLENQLKNISDKYENIALSDSNAYAIPYVDRIFDVPMASSGYDIFSYDVPFYHMVVNGFASYTTPSVVQSVNYDAMILKAIETGSDLLFDCVYIESSKLRDTELSSSYSSQYESWKDKAIKKYNEVLSVTKIINGSCIAEHFKIFEDVYCTEYENGIKVYVNYSENSVTIGSVTVESNGYAIEEA